MEHEINSWLESLTPGSIAVSGTLNVEPTATFLKVSEMPEMPAEVPTPSEAEAFVFSYPALTGDNKTQLLQADRKISKAYTCGGDSDPKFLNKFKEAPVTGMTTLMNYIQIQKGFIPQEGHFSIQKFGSFMESLGTCPIVITGSTQSLKHDTTVTNINEKNFDRKEIVDTIVRTYELNTGQSSKIEEKLREARSDTIKLTIYNMQIYGSSTEAFFAVNAGVTTITRTEVHKLRPRFQFEINLRGNKVTSSIQQANWEAFAPKIAKLHFASISEWIKANKLSIIDTYEAAH